jgi:hypothetical protein
MAQIVSDNFTRANAATLGANWTGNYFSSPTLSEDFAIASNRATTNTDARDFSGFYSGAAWTGGNDQYAEITVQTKAAASDCGPTVRGATAAQTFYTCDINNADTAALGSTMSVEVYVVSAGSFTLIGSTVNMVVSAGDVIRVEAQGTTIRGLVNGVQKVSGTNSTLSSGKVGMQCWEGISTFSLFAAGDFSSGAAFLPKPNLPMLQAVKRASYW